MTSRAIVITGASGGLGAALAQAYAGHNVVLGLIGRNGTALAHVADACRMAGANVEVMVCDVRAREPLAAHLRAFDRAHRLDLVVANAGVALPEDGDEAIREVLDVNLAGALNTILPLMPDMVARGSGQIAFVSSLAALSPLADAAAYSASKAALLAYGLALRQKLAPAGVRVSVICPGFVRTGMGARYKGWRPLEMSAEAAAGRIVAGLARNRALVAFPWPLYAATRLGTVVPERVLRGVMRLFGFSIARG